MERYYISHVKKDANGVVNEVMLHYSDGNNLSKIGVRTIASIIQLINSNYSVYTMLWGYPGWNIGAEVIVVRSAYGQNFLRTNRNATDRDNLDNLIPL